MTLQEQMDAICDALSEHDNPCEPEDAVGRIEALRKEIESLRPFYLAAVAKEEAEAQAAGEAYYAQQEAFCDSHCCWSGHHKDCVRYDPPAGWRMSVQEDEDRSWLRIVSPEGGEMAFSAQRGSNMAQLMQDFSIALMSCDTLTDDKIDRLAHKHGTSLNTHDNRLLFSRMRWREFAREVLATARGADRSPR